MKKYWKLDRGRPWECQWKYLEDLEADTVHKTLIHILNRSDKEKSSEET